MAFQLASKAACVAAALVLSACTSGYKEFYKPAQGITPQLLAERRAGPPPATPAVEHGQAGEGQQIVDAYAKHGYGLIGYVSFNSGKSEPDSNAVHQGQAVGADLVVIMNPHYTGSITTSIPITTPTTNTTTSTGTATAYGSGGTVTAYGSGTSTTYGSKTTYIPLTINRSDYGALFFVKIHYSLGANVRDLTDAERQEMQSNKGVAVRNIVDGTPAFEADILVGDMIVSVDGVSVSNAASFNDIVRERKGKLVAVSIIRGGQKIEKSVQLN